MAATSSPSLLARAQAAAAAQRRRPAPPKRPATTRRGTPLPAFLRGSRTAAQGVWQAYMPKGNAQAVMKRFNMPKPLTADMRGEDLNRRFGPIVGPRAQMATVASFQGVEGMDGLDGFSFKKLTNWVGNAAKAVASKDPAAILSVAAAAVPGGKTPNVVAKPPPPPPPPLTQFYDSMKPQNSTQTMMMVGAGVLGLGLVAMLLKRR